MRRWVNGMWYRTGVTERLKKISLYRRTAWGHGKKKTGTLKSYVLWNSFVQFAILKDYFLNLSYGEMNNVLLATKGYWVIIYYNCSDDVKCQLFMMYLWYTFKKAFYHRLKVVYTCNKVFTQLFKLEHRSSMSQVFISHNIEHLDIIVCKCIISCNR